MRRLYYKVRQLFQNDVYSEMRRLLQNALPRLSCIYCLIHLNVKHIFVIKFKLNSFRTALKVIDLSQKKKIFMRTGKTGIYCLLKNSSSNEIFCPTSFLSIYNTVSLRIQFECRKIIRTRITPNMDTIFTQCNFSWLPIFSQNLVQ